MTAQIIDGNKIAQEIRDDLKKKILEIDPKIRKPGLAVIIVGDDEASHYYVRNKERKCAEVGIESFKSELPQNISKAELISVIESYNQDPNVDGILLQLPLPDALKECTDEVINHILPDKDVDGLTTINQGKLLAYQKTVEPCTPKGCMELLKRAGVIIESKKAVVIGRSNLVGKPLAIMLSKANATVTLLHSRTIDIAEEVKTADIVIAAIGKKEFVKGSWLKEGAVVIDVGINAIDDNGQKKIFGDVDFESAKDKAAFISPVPGGVGPLTIAMLLVNTWGLYSEHLVVKKK